MSTSDLIDVRLGVDFGFGIDTKTDQKLALKTKLLRSENTRINAIGRIDKRNGTKSLPNVDSDGNIVGAGQALGMLDSELIEITSSELLSFGEAEDAFVPKGAITPLGVNRRIVQSNLSNLQSVNAASVNGVTLYAYDSVATNTVSWLVVDELSGTVYQSGSQLGGQQPQIVVANGKLILLYGTVSGSIVAKVFSSSSPRQTPGTFALAGITLSGTVVFGAATDGTSTILVSAANNAGGITTVAYNATTMALVTSATATPGFGPPFISVAYLPNSTSGCNWGIYYPDLVGNVWVRFYSTNLATTFGWTPILGSSANPYGPGCIRQSPTNTGAVIVYATRYNPQGNGQGLLQAPCGQSVQAFGLVVSSGVIIAMFPANLFKQGCQLASFPWDTGNGTSANILVQYQVDPTVAAQYPSGETPLSLQPTAFIIDADTGAVVGRGPTGQAMVASQSLSGSGSYQVLPRASQLPGRGIPYLLSETSNVVVHVNASDLHEGTAQAGPSWTPNGSVPFAEAGLAPPSVGPFTANDFFQLPVGNPLSFGTGKSFCVTAVFAVTDPSSQPALIGCTSSADDWGWMLFIDGIPGPPHFFNFSMYNFATGLGAYELFSDIQAVAGQTYVVSAGYDDATQTAFLKVNTRPTLTLALGYANQAATSTAQIGTYHQVSPPVDFPLDGGIYEILVTTDRPSQARFSDLYDAATLGLAQFSDIFLLGLGASLNLEVNDSAFVFGQGVGELLLDYGQARGLFVEQLASNAHVTGGMLQRYDGQSVAEHGFPLAPEFLQVQGATTISGEVASLIDIAFTPPTLAGPFSVTTITFPPGSQVAPGEWWAMDDSGAVLGGSGSNLSAAPTKYFWYRVNGVGTDPAPVPAGGTVVDILSTDTSLQVAQKTCARLSFTIVFSLKSVTTQNGNAVVEFQISTPYPAGGSGLTTIPTVQSGKFRVAETVAAVNGTSTSSRCYSIACCPGAFIKPGQYWQFNLGQGSGAFGVVCCLPYVWYKVDGVGTDPGSQPILSSNPGSAVSFGVEVDITSADTAATVATKTYNALTGNAVVNGGIRAAVGTLPASGHSGNFIFLSLTTNSGVAAPDLLVPEIGGNVSVGAGALGLPRGQGTSQTAQYAVAGVYAEVDGKGNIHRSAPNGSPNGAGQASPVFFTAPRSPVSDTRVVYGFPYLHLTNKTTVLLELYRTTANSSTFNKQTSTLSPVVNNPLALMATIPDSLQDNRDPGDTTSPFLGSNEFIYTTGGALQHDPLDPCSIAHVHRGRLWTAGFTSDRLRAQASMLEPGNFGVAFTNDASHVLELPPDGDDITAFGTLDEKLAIFKASQIYLTAGDGPDKTGQNGAFLVPERVSSEVGCIAPKAVVSLPNGLLFRSAKGFELLDRNLVVTHLEEADGYNGLTVTSASKRDGDEHVIFTTLQGPTLVYNYIRNAWMVDLNSGAVDSILWAPQTPGQVTPKTLYYLTPDGKVHGENPGDYTDDGVPFSRLIQLAWLEPADQRQGFARIREILFLGFWPGLQYETLTLEYNYGQLPASTLTFNLTGSQGVWGSSTPWGGDGVWGGSGKDITQWGANPPIQKLESIRITLQDIAPFVTDRAAQLAHIDFVAGVKRGQMKLPASAKIGS